LQPLSSSKEVLTIDGRPIMDYLIERMRVAPCDELRVVTRPEKTDVAERALALGAEVIQAYPSSVAASLLAGLSGLRADDIVLFGFPDSLWDPVDGFVQLVDGLDEATRSTDAFLWVTFTRMEPAADLHGRERMTSRFHTGLVAPVVIDARTKPGYPKAMVVDDDTRRLVDRRWDEYGIRL
jgi:hypothetical protein